MNATGPFWGHIVDARGPRILLASAFLLLLAGYSGTRYIFDSGIPPDASTVSTFSIVILCICSAMVGAGGNAATAGAVNATAKTFPQAVCTTTFPTTPLPHYPTYLLWLQRGSATGLVMSGYGLSALLFSVASRIAVPGNTSSFLQLLAFGTSLPMILGFCFIRPIPPPPTEKTIALERVGSSDRQVGDEQERLLSNDELAEDSESS